MSDKLGVYNNKVYVCSVDYEMAFDQIYWVKLLDILGNIGCHVDRLNQFATTVLTQYWSLSSKQTLFNIVHFARGLDVLIYK